MKSFRYRSNAVSRKNNVLPVAVCQDGRMHLLTSFIEHYDLSSLDPLPNSKVSNPNMPCTFRSASLRRAVLYVITSPFLIPAISESCADTVPDSQSQVVRSAQLPSSTSSRYSAHWICSAPLLHLYHDTASRVRFPIRVLPVCSVYENPHAYPQ